MTIENNSFEVGQTHEF